LLLWWLTAIYYPILCADRTVWRDARQIRVAAFVTSHGTMDHADRAPVYTIAASADLTGANPLASGQLPPRRRHRCVDVLFFRKRRPGAAPDGAVSETLAEFQPAEGDSKPIRVNSISSRIPACC
jgi:hypothetical protein